MTQSAVGGGPSKAVSSGSLQLPQAELLPGALVQEHWRHRSAGPPPGHGGCAVPGSRRGWRRVVCSGGALCAYLVINAESRQLWRGEGASLMNTPATRVTR